MKILLTGGAGYIGSHVLKLLGEASHEITVIDNLSSGRKESILYGNHLNFDLAESDKLEKIISEGHFDCCFHFAGSIIVPESVTDPIKYYSNNTLNTFHLLRLCHQYKINKFIFSSTAAVYGDADDGVCSEETPVKPINPYGNTKYMTECMLNDFTVAYPDFKFIILRYFNVAGASLDGKIGQCSKVSTHLIKIASEVAVGKRDRMYIFGDDYDTPDGTCIRDYIHVEDLAQAHVDGLNYLSEGGSSQTMNCGYGKGYSVKEVIETMKKHSVKDLKVEIGPRRDGDAKVLISKAEKIQGILNWTPKFNDIDLICKTAIHWEKKFKN